MIDRHAPVTEGELNAYVDGEVSAERRAANDREECQAQGYPPSTSAFDNCLLNIGHLGAG